MEKAEFTNAFKSVEDEKSYEQAKKEFMHEISDEVHESLTECNTLAMRSAHLLKIVSYLSDVTQTLALYVFDSEANPLNDHQKQAAVDRLETITSGSALAMGAVMAAELDSQIERLKDRFSDDAYVDEDSAIVKLEKDMSEDEVMEKVQAVISDLLSNLKGEE